ncbi:MAG: hypothetical protein M0R48_01725 [Candidatus Omnitrophica bacterium]|jgi:hypothetical protein|nr:hypothetical protein [Candidatus Omnitrophota bacterium]
MNDNFSNFLDPIAKVWNNQQVLPYALSMPKAKIDKKIKPFKRNQPQIQGLSPTKKVKTKIILKKGYQAG